MKTGSLPLRRSSDFILIWICLLNIISIAAASLLAAETALLAGSATPTACGDSASNPCSNGVGTSATFGTLGGIAVSLDGRTVYVSDEFNHNIREIDVESATVKDLAGLQNIFPASGGLVDGQGSSAIFNRPEGLALTGDGASLLIADYSNFAIRSIDIGTGVVSTIAGNGETGTQDGVGTNAKFQGPRDIAITSEEGPTLIVTDTDAHILRKVVVETGAVTQLAGSVNSAGSADGVGTNAYFNQPLGVIASSDGNDVYICDSENHRVRLLKMETLAVETFVGFSQGDNDGIGTHANFNIPAGLGISYDSNYLFVCDQQNNRVRIVNVDTRHVTTLVGQDHGYNEGTGTNAMFQMPRAIALPASSSPGYIVDSGNRLVRRFGSGVVTTNQPTNSLVPSPAPSDTFVPTFTFAPTLAPSLWAGLLLEEREVITMAGGSTSCDYSLGTCVDGIGVSAALYDPRAIALSLDGRTIFVAEQNTLRYIDLRTRQVAFLAGSPTGTEGSHDGFGTSAAFGGITSLCSLKDDILIIAQTYDQRIRSLNTTSLEVQTIAYVSDKDPNGVACSENGEAVYVATSGNNIKKFTWTAYSIVNYVDMSEVCGGGASGSDSGDQDGIGSSASFNNPQQITLWTSEDGNDMLAVADLGNGRVRQVDVETQAVITLAGESQGTPTDDGTGTTAKFMEPYGITSTQDGSNLFISDKYCSNIRLLERTVGSVTTYSGAPPNSCGNAGTADGVGTAASFYGPAQLAIARHVGGASTRDLSDATVFVADRSNHLVRAIGTGISGTPSPSVTYSPSATPTVWSGIKSLAKGEREELGRFASVDILAAAVTRDERYLYFSDPYQIYQMDIQTRDFTILAGSDYSGSPTSFSEVSVGTNAKFMNPNGLEVIDDGATLVVSDTNNHLIRLIDIETAAVSNLAGSILSPGFEDGVGDTAKFSSPFGVCGTGDGLTVFVADWANHLIRKIDVSSQTVSTLAGGMSWPSYGPQDGSGEAADFYLPRGLATDDSYIYVADSMNSKIRRVSIADSDVVSEVSLLTDTNGNTLYPQDIAIAVDGSTTYMFVSALDNLDHPDKGHILTFNGTSKNGELKKDFLGASNYGKITGITTPRSASVAYIAASVMTPSPIGSVHAIGTGLFMSCGLGFFFDEILGFCRACRVGEYQNISSGYITRCRSCDPGTGMSSGSAVYPCESCTEGKASLGGFPGCKLCDAGKYTAYTGQSLCSSCPVGLVSSELRNLCSFCNPGFYVFNSSSCEPCEMGRYAPAALNDACIICEAGFQTNLEIKATSCTACDAGKSSPGRTTNCTDCMIGTFSSNASPNCTECSKGRFNNKVAQDSCTACSAGRVSNIAGSVSCSSCIPGKAQSATGQSECDSCNPGTYASSWGSSVCSDCPGNSYSISGQDGPKACRACNKNYFYSLEGQCRTSPTGTECLRDGSCTQKNLKIKAGHWRLTENATVIYPCPLDEGKSCNGSAYFRDSGNSYCAPGYEGPLCAVCQENFWFSVEDGTCKSCDDLDDADRIFQSTGIIILLCLIGLILVIYSLYKLYGPPQEEEEVDGDEEKPESFDEATSAGGEVETTSANTRTSVLDVNGAGKVNRRDLMDALDQYGDDKIITEDLPAPKAPSALIAFFMTLRKLRRKFQTRMKAFWSFGQILVNIGFNCDIPWPETFSYIIDALSIINIDLVPHLGLACRFQMDYIGELVATTLTPILVSILIFVLYILSSLSNCFISDKEERRAKIASSGQTYFYMFLIWTYLVLIGASSKTFFYFKCHTLYEEEGDYSEAYLYKDYSLDCSSARYAYWRTFAIAMIFIYPIGIPFLYFVLVHNHRSILGDKAALDIEEQNNFPTVGHVTFLTDAYKTSYYWFETLECIRRLLLASVVGMVSEYSAAAPLMGLLISTGFTWVFTALSPFDSKNDNALSVVLAYSLLLFFLAALLIRVNTASDDRTDGNVFSALLIFVLASGPCVLVVMSMRDAISVIVHRFCSGHKKESSTLENNQNDINNSAAADDNQSECESAMTSSMSSIPESASLNVRAVKKNAMRQKTISRSKMEVTM